MAEQVFFSENGVNITNARAVVGGKTYAMSNITSVTMAKKKINIFLLVVLGLIGLGSLSVIGQSPIVALVILAICAALIYFLVKPSYRVILGSASGEAEALVSSNRTQIERIVSAMNDAIIKRG
ncbi:MAG TPA: DUF6232 family protein [Ktedonosporobacter sp.]|nr:DUF6232 family protein [Ktedonosporobacter sp.]